MIEFLGKSWDDPPIFAVRVTGEDAATELHTWLAERPHVQQLELELTGGAAVPRREVAQLAKQFEVRIDVRSTGTGSSQPAPTT